jgi:hypothetical protein
MANENMSAKARTGKSALPARLDFEGVEIRIIDCQGRPWVPQHDLTRALYGLKGGDTSVGALAGPSRSVNRLFNKNKDEFTDDMTALLTMETAGGPQQVRIYSARGCYLMGMLAKTETAKRFRRWVLDVLEGGPGLAGASKFGIDLSKGNLPALRARTAAMNAVSRSLEVLIRSAGRRPAALAAPDLYRTVGVSIDLTGSDTLAQRELELPETHAQSQ